jgi:broad specificity phosphatase PhoE
MPRDPHGLFDPQRQNKLLLMRHPQTMQNLELRYQGQRNVPLSPLGEQQRDRAVQGLINWHPDLLYSSPLDRCRAIATPVAEALDLELNIDDRLMEMNFGRLEGLTHDEAIEQGIGFPWDPSAGEWPVAGAETMEQFASRLMAAADALAQLEGRVAVVTHGGAIRAISSYWLHISPEFLWGMAVRNVESAIFSADGLGTIYLENFGLQPEWLSAE